MRFLLAFLLLPLLEIAGFAWVGGKIGALNTVLLVVAAAVLGVLLLRRHGFSTLQRAQAEMNRGEPPLKAAFDGLCVAFAGMLLIVPGFLTDIIGLTLLLPPVRGWLFRRAGRMVVERAPQPQDQTTIWRAEGQPRYQDPTVIEGDFTEVRDTSPEELPPADSRWRPPGR